MLDDGDSDDEGPIIYNRIDECDVPQRGQLPGRVSKRDGTGWPPNKVPADQRLSSSQSRVQTQGKAYLENSMQGMEAIG